MLIMVPEALMKKIEAQRKSFFEDELVPNAEAWNEDTTKFKEWLCVKGETYRPPLLFDTPAILPTDTHMAPEKVTLSPCGRFVHAIRRLPRGHPLGIYKGRQRGQVFFTTDVNVPVLGEVLDVRSPPKVWMSLTPHEMISQRQGVRLATGTVLVGGLGMGWFLQKVCAKPSVKKVILVERRQPLIDWLLPAIKKLWPHVNEKLQEVVAGDAVAAVGRHGQKTRYLLDIWETYGEAKRDGAWQEAKARAKHVWGWGDVDAAKE
jgi:hypothetical protein